MRYLFDKGRSAAGIYQRKLYTGSRKIRVYRSFSPRKPERDIQNAESDKREWVRKHLGEDVVVNVVYTEQKKYYAQGRSTLLIDDWVSNITDWCTAGGSAYHFFNVEHLRRYLSEMGVLEYMDPRSQTQTAIMRFVSDLIRLMAKTDPELTIRGNGNLERFYADCVSRVNELAEELGTDYHTYCTGLVAFMDLFRALYPIGRSLDLLYHFTEDSYLRMKVDSVLETHCGLLEEMYRSEILAGVRADARVPTDSLDELANFIFDSFSECTRCVGELNRYDCFPVNLSQPWTDFRDSVSEFRSAYRAAILRPQYVLRIDEASAEYVSHPRIAPMAIKEMVFQKRLADRCIERNSLIVLPEGFGKTTIAALVAARVLEHGKKVLYLTPTRPLAERAFHTISSIMNNTKMAMLQKTMDRDDRADAIRFADLVISTPQCIQSDLMDGVYGLDGFGLVIYEEAHRAIGEYEYVTISKHNPGKSMGLMELSNNSQINAWMNEAVKYNLRNTHQNPDL